MISWSFDHQAFFSLSLLTKKSGDPDFFQQNHGLFFFGGWVRRTQKTVKVEMILTGVHSQTSKSSVFPCFSLPRWWDSFHPIMGFVSPNHGIRLTQSWDSFHPIWWTWWNQFIQDKTPWVNFKKKNNQGIGKDVPLIPTYPVMGNPYISPRARGYLWVIIPKGTQ